MKSIIIIALLAGVFSLLASSAYCQDSCMVVLKNGNKLEANSCRIDGDKILLKYPTGEAAFELSQVETITGGDGSEPFQDKGTAQPDNTPAPEKPVVSASNIVPLPAPSEVSGGTGVVYRDQPTAAPSEQEKAVSEDQAEQAEKEQKFQDFFSKYRQSGEEDQAEMSRQVDTVFSDYLNSGAPAQSGPGN